MGSVRQIHPVSRDIEPRQIYADAQFAPRPDRPYLALNFVTSLDGRVTVGGRAAGLGSAVDRQTMRQLRARADALLVGAGTLRAEPIDPRVPPDLADLRETDGRPPQPLFVLITAFGSLPDRKVFHMADVQRLILSPRSADANRLRRIDPEAEIVVLGESWVDLAEAMRYLRGRGIRSVMCEGGPSLAGGLMAAGLVDELFLTVAPTLVGGAGLRLLEGSFAAGGQQVAVDLVSAFEQNGELFLRYHLLR
jgi:riboflavin-specific deaminase-like protein